MKQYRELLLPLLGGLVHFPQALTPRRGRGTRQRGDSGNGFAKNGFCGVGKALQSEGERHGLSVAALGQHAGCIFAQVFLKENHTMAGRDIFIRLEYDELRGIQFTLHILPLEHLVNLPVTKDRLTRHGVFVEFVVRIPGAEHHIIGNNAVGQRLHTHELLVLKQVAEIECVLSANTVGIAEELIAHAVKGVLIFRHIFANHMILRQYKRCEHNNDFALYGGVFLTLKKRPQQRQATQHRHAIFGALLVLGDEAADDEGRIVRHAHVGAHFALGDGGRTGQHRARTVFHLHIGIRHLGCHLGVHLHVHHLAAAIHPRAQRQRDAGLLYVKARALIIVAGRIAGVGHRNILGHIDIGHAIVQREHARAGEHFRLAFTHQRLDLCVEVGKNVLRGEIEGFIRTGMFQAANRQGTELVVDEISAGGG